MPFYRICPLCHRRNNPQDMLCPDCMTDISLVKPERINFQSGPDITQPFSDIKISGVLNGVLILICADGRTLHINREGILGRESEGAGIFGSGEGVRAVSKRHARIFSENDRWFITDLNSTNGTYVNGEKLEPDARRELLPGDTISLSLSSVDLTVL